jgi:Skp family chaperone for outer membrane proteins
MTSRRWMIVGGLVMANVLLLASLPSEAQVAGGQSSVAVCDVVKVFREYNRAKAMQSELEGQRKSMETQDLRRKKALKSMDTALKGINPGTPKYQEEENKLRRAMIEHEVWLKMAQTQILRKHALLMRDMYDSMRKTVAAIAKARGVTLVLQMDGASLTGRNSQEMMGQISSRKVIYAGSQIDITDELIQKLNASYKPAQPTR